MSGLRIVTNVPGLIANRLLTETSNRLQRSMERLSSGYRINRAADDAAGLALSERIRTQVNGLERAQRNALDAISVVQIAEGGLTLIADMIQRIRALAIQAANDVYTTADRQLMQVEVNELIAEIDRQASVTKFGELRLLLTNGSLVIQVGANQGETISIRLQSTTTTTLGIDRLSTTDPVTGNLTTGGILTRTGAASALTLLASALDILQSRRAVLGAAQNRLERTVSFIGISRENQSAADSRLRELDFADEIVKFTRDQILQQTGVSALAQANLIPSAVLALLG